MTKISVDVPDEVLVLARKYHINMSHAARKGINREIEMYANAEKHNG